MISNIPPAPHHSCHLGAEIYFWPVDSGKGVITEESSGEVLVLLRKKCTAREFVAEL
jgi:hypothetical protein